MSSDSNEKGRTVNLATLSTQQLNSVKKQLDDELEHLTNAFTKLQAAQAQFRECLNSVNQGISQRTAGKAILVPLTASLYVPGALADTDKVIVDIGTGFFVERSTKDAIIFYEGKIEELAGNLKNLESVVQGKSDNLRVVEDGVAPTADGTVQIKLTTDAVLRQKVLGSAESVQELRAQAASR